MKRFYMLLFCYRTALLGNKKVVSTEYQHVHLFLPFNVNHPSLPASGIVSEISKVFSKDKLLVELIYMYYTFYFYYFETPLHIIS